MMKSWSWSSRSIWNIITNIFLLFNLLWKQKCGLNCFLNALIFCMAIMFFRRSLLIKPILINIILLKLFLWLKVNTLWNLLRTALRIIHVTIFFTTWQFINHLHKHFWIYLFYFIIHILYFTKFSLLLFGELFRKWTLYVEITN